MTSNAYGLRLLAQPRVRLTILALLATASRHLGAPDSEVTEVDEDEILPVDFVDHEDALFIEVYDAAIRPFKALRSVKWVDEDRFLGQVKRVTSLAGQIALGPLVSGTARDPDRFHSGFRLWPLQSAHRGRLR